MHRSFLILFSVVVLSSGSLYDDLQITTPVWQSSAGESILLHRDTPECMCSPNAKCEWVPNEFRTECVCKTGYVGTPQDCKPGPELWDACFKGNPCGPHSECTLENGTRTCTCLANHKGQPPNCRPAGPVWKTCLCGPHAGCDVALEPACFCLPGFVGNPPQCRPSPEMWRVCFKDRPCGFHAECRMDGNSVICSCAKGFLGKPPHCYPAELKYPVQVES